MNTYKRLKKIREHIVLLPGFRSFKDFDIAIEIGHHELSANPLTQKQLLLLNIASPATVRRHLNRLVKVGLVEKHQYKDDHRVIYFTLSGHAHSIFDQCVQQVGMLLGAEAD